MVAPATHTWQPTFLNYLRFCSTDGKHSLKRLFQKIILRYRLVIHNLLKKGKASKQKQQYSFSSASDKHIAFFYFIAVTLKANAIHIIHNTPCIFYDQCTISNDFLLFPNTISQVTQTTPSVSLILSKQAKKIVICADILHLINADHNVMHPLYMFKG